MSLPPWAVVTPRRREHIERVAALVDRFSHERGVAGPERERWLRAAWLHDALKDAPPEEMARYAPQGDWPAPLWHAAAAAAAAEAHGERDRGVIDAVRYHPLGFSGWDDAGRMLFLADYLEPGRPEARAQRDAWTLRVAHDRDAVLREVLAARIALLLHAMHPVRPETWDYWNHLTAGA